MQVLSKSLSYFWLSIRTDSQKFWVQYMYAWYRSLIRYATGITTIMTKKKNSYLFALICLTITTRVSAMSATSITKRVRITAIQMSSMIFNSLYYLCSRLNQYWLIICSKQFNKIFSIWYEAICIFTQIMIAVLNNLTHLVPSHICV